MHKHAAAAAAIAPPLAAKSSAAGALALAAPTSVALTHAAAASVAVLSNAPFVCRGGTRAYVRRRLQLHIPLLPIDLHRLLQPDGATIT